jgi:WS/DGAT/MGAT family acyltransferase
MDIIREQQNPVTIARNALEYLSPAAAMQRWADITKGFATMAGLNVLPRTSLNQQIGRHRRFESVRVPLDDVRRTKRALGGTVNDVVLAAVTGGLRRLLLSRGEPVEHLELRAFVPVSVRDDSERGAFGNRVAAMFVPLPVGVPDAVGQLREITASTADLKERKQAVGAQYLASLNELAPPALFAQAARLSNDQRMVNLTVTNVPGPQHPLYFMGAKLLEWHPMVPLSENMTIGIPVISYNGILSIGVYTDRDTVPDVAVLADGIRQTLRDLEAAAEPAPAAPSPAPLAPILVRYSPEVREKAVRAVLDRQHDYSSRSAAIAAVAQELGMTRETLRRWVRQAEARAARPRATS